MDDLISRQAAIDAICKACANGDDYTACRDRDIKSRWCDNITALRDLPSAQPKKVLVVEVKLDGEELRKCVDRAVKQIREEEMPEIVRCKDCKYWDTSGYCFDFMTQDEDGFCKWAERRRV